VPLSRQVRRLSADTPPETPLLAGDIASPLAELMSLAGRRQAGRRRS